MSGRRRLDVLDEKIATRARSIRERHPWWPCAKGCDRCCRSLAREPEMSRPEWDRLIDAVQRLPQDEQVAIFARIDAMTQAARVCPLLDERDGACMVYEARPVACRTYGFYVQRDGGLHCETIASAVDEHAEDVVWGNGDAVLDELASLGDARTLREWLATWRAK